MRAGVRPGLHLLKPPFWFPGTYGPIGNCLGEGEGPGGSTGPSHVPSPALVLGGLAAQLCPQRALGLPMC